MKDTMINIFFLEFAQDVPCFLEHRHKDDIVIALRPEVLLELDIRQIPYKCLQTDYYSHEEYMANASECRRELLPIIQALDTELYKVDGHYKTAGIKPFQMFMYLFKSPFDCLRSKVFELDKLFSKENVAKVRFIRHQTQPIKNDMCFYDDESVYERLLYLMRENYKYNIEAIDSKCNVANDIIRDYIPNSRISAWKDIYFIKQLKAVLKSLYRLKSLNRKGNILSVNCAELPSIKQELIGLGWSIHEYSIDILHDNGRFSERYIGLVNRFEKNKDLMKLFDFLGVNFFTAIKSRLEYFCRRLETILRNYQILSSYIDRHHFDIVFFNTHTPFSVQDIMLPLICRERKIPYVCWMHGAYGANYRVPGYELSDYTFGQYYFVYGEEVKKVIDSYYPQYNLITHVTGSSRMLRRYQNYVSPKNNKKVITFVTSPWSTNRLHLEVDSPYSRFSYWMPSKAILELLIRYRYKYRIIIRTGRCRVQIETFKKFLKNHNAEEIEIITIAEMPFEEIVKVTDLFINLWVSTPFWEECFTCADIFVMDNSDFTDEAKKIIPKRAFWYDNLTEFIQRLQQYLDKGIFYQKSKDNSFLKSYLDFERKDRVPEHVSQTIEDIINKNGYINKST